MIKKWAVSFLAEMASLAYVILGLNLLENCNYSLSLIC
jgi:hypothetical protein